ncbi:nose resistant to fluoxetine protein 6-like [Symsagittifera roscoffensis]|uniref:nose resistant to fluoxetine protein 6-like n=1 Tax=Symsagittifera roscoffensis TaxID=84072 RepID=UPI00307BF39D
MKISVEVWNRTMHPLFTYGVCFPQRCSDQDVKVIADILINNDKNLKDDISVVAVYSTDNGEFDFTFGLACFVFGIIALLIAVGTGMDYLIDYMKEQLVKSENSYQSTDDGAINEGNEEKESESSVLLEKSERRRSMKVEHLAWCRFLVSFSLATNIPKLLSTKSGEGAILCLNGIRVLSLGWVILGHTMYYLLFTEPAGHLYWNNYFFSFNYFQVFGFQVIGNATLSVDSFFVLSAFLLTLLTLKKMQQYEGKIKPMFWVMFYVRRYIRLTPALLLIILFTVGIWKVLGNNTVPRWQPNLNEVEGCVHAWWANLLYINNLYTTYECLPWTWYLANDFQFYCLSPVLVVAMYKRPMLGVGLTAGLVMVSMLSNFVESMVNDYPAATSFLLNYESFPVYNFDGVFNALYIKPWNRFCSYGVGMILGFIVFKSPAKIKVANKLYIALGWLAYTVVSMSVLYGLYGVAQGHFPSKFMSAVYNAFGRVGWSISVSWLIWACMYGYAGFINSFLSMRLWIPLARVTYMTYLIHVLVIQYIYLTADSTFNYTPITYAVQFCSNIVLAFGFGFIAVLMLESPIVGIEKILMG